MSIGDSLLSYFGGGVPCDEGDDLAALARIIRKNQEIQSNKPLSQEKQSPIGIGSYGVWKFVGAISEWRFIGIFRAVYELIGLVRSIHKSKIRF